MYCDFFGLRANPFEDRADARLYCPTPDHEEAIAAMEYAAHYGKGLSLLLGAAGTGKTMLVRVLSQRLHSTDHVVVLTVPTGQTANVLRDVAKGFGVTLPSHPSSRKCLARLRRMLIQKLEADHRSILILDQAENLTDEDLRKVAALTELQRDDRKLLEVIFVGQPHFKALLGTAEFSRMRQQAFGERSLRPLTFDETATLVVHRLTHCGAGSDTFFTDEAVRAVFDASKGNCRLINKICNAAMVAAYGAHRERIDESIIAEVVQSQPASAKPSENQDTDTDRPRGQDDTPPTSPVAPGPGMNLQAASAPVSSVARPMHFDEDEHRILPAEEPAEVRVNAACGRGASMRNRRALTTSVSASSVASTAAEAERAERLLRGVERSRAMQAASLAQYSTLEAQLEELAGTEDRISTNIDDSLGRANDFFEDVEQRGRAMIRATEARVVALEERARKAEQVAASAEQRLDQINEAAQRGIDVEQRLNAFARELGDRVDQAQERVGLLMTGMEAGHEAHNRLESMANQVNELAAQVDERVRTERSGLDESIARAERCRADLSEEAVSAHRTEVLKAIKDADRRELETAKAALADYHDQLRDLIDRSHTKLDGVGSSIKARHAEVNAAVSTCTQVMSELESASKEKFSSLSRVYDEQVCDLVDRSRTQLDAAGISIKARCTDVEAAVSTCTGAVAKLQSDSQEKLASLNQLCDAIEARGEKVAKVVGGADSEAQRIIAEADEVVGTLRDERETVDQRIEECRRVAEEAGQTQSVLAATLEEKIAQIGSHHAAASSLVRQLTERTQAGHECYAKLGSSRKAAGEVIAELDQVRAAAHAEAGPLVKALRDAMERGGAQLDETKVVQGRIEAVQRTVEGSLMHVGSACERAAELEAQVAGCAMSLQLMGEKEGAVAALVEQANQARTAIESATGEARRSHDQLSGAVDRSSSLLKEVRETHAQLGSRHAGAQSVLHQLTAAEERSRETLGGVEEACERARATVESVERVEGRSIEAGATERRLAATLDQGVALLHDTKATQERLEAVHRTVSAGLVESGAALERINTVREQTKDCERLVEALGEAQERGDSLSANLSHMVADGHMVHDALAQILRESDDKAEALGASANRAVELVDRLSGAKETAAETARKIEQASAMAGERASAVERVNQQSRETVEQAESRIKTLSHLREQVTGVIESANQKARETQAASERLERLTEDVWSLSGTSEARAKELASRQGEASSMLKQITIAAASIKKITTPLSDLVRLAEKQRDGLEKGCHGAEELTDRLKAVPALIEASKQSQAELAKAAGRTDELRRGLSEIVGQADHHIAAMHDLREASEVAERLTFQRTEAACVLDRLEKASASCKGLAGRIVSQADRIVDRVGRADRLTERIDGQEIRLETGAKSIASLAKQVQAVASGIKDLQQKSARIDESVTQAVEKSMNAITTAQGQTAQLETVCSAVRKVFAGLSKTTIDSKKQKDAFEAVSQEAGTRLVQLKTETDRATRTLHQWVEEATRAQARLAETLERVPSIAQTHQPDALTRLSSVAAGPIKTMPAEEGMRIVAQPHGINAPTAATSDADGPADEVARMIEEAKRAPVAGRS